MERNISSGLAFKGRISSHFEALLRLSMGLTKNGRDTMRLLHETFAEVTPTWDESTSDDIGHFRLYDVLTRRFLDGFQFHGRSVVTARDRKIDDSLIRRNRLFPLVQDKNLRGSLPVIESDEQIEILETIAQLPAPLRPAMFLSFVEGFSNEEIARLAGTQPHDIEAGLHRSCRLVQSRLLSMFVGNSKPFAAANEEAKSA